MGVIELDKFLNVFTALETGDLPMNALKLLLSGAR